MNQAMLILGVLLMCVASVPAQPGPDATIPDSPVGNHLKAFLEAFNSGDEEQRLQFILDHFKSGEDSVNEMVADYDKRRRIMVNGLSDIGLSCFEPKGAFYAFPSIKRTGMNSEEFAERLLTEEKVAVVPGSAFGEAGEGYIRCCYATSLSDIEEALKRMKRFVDKYSKE